MANWDNENRPLILLTGGSGYVGGHLIPLLENLGVKLRCLARSPDKMRSRVRPGTETVRGDVLDPASLDRALQGVDTVEFRASLVIGTGSLSFDLVKALTDRLPVMICPRWLTTPTQPIAVDDVLAYLLAANDLPPGRGRIFEIGSPDVTTYGGMIREYARQKALRRW